MGLFSSKKTTVGFKYFLGIHLVGCHGPIDALRKLVFDKKTAWEGNVTENQTVDVDAEDLFGGKDSEGGVGGTMDVLMGAVDQPVSAYLQDKQAADVPAYRGVFSLLFRNFYVGNSPYLKAPGFVAKRIHVRTIEGIEQWYDEKAEIGAGGGEDVGALTRVQSYFDDDSSEDISASALGPGTINGPYALVESGSFQLGGGHLSDHATLTYGPAFELADVDGTGWRMDVYSTCPVLPMTAYDFQNIIADYRFTDEAGTTRVFQVRWTGGTSNPNSVTVYAMGTEFLFVAGGIPLGERTLFTLYHIDNIFGLKVNGVGVWATSKPTVAAGGGGSGTVQLGAIPNVVAGAPGWLGERWYTVDEFRWRLLNGGGIPADFDPVTDPEWNGHIPPPDGGAVSSDYGDMNPAHIIRECLTDPDWGLGYTDDDIDDTSFMAAADTLWDEGLGMSLLWDKQIPLEDFIKEVQKHIDSVLYVDRTTGKFVLKLIRDDYDEEGLLELDPSNVSRVENYSERRFEEMVNSVTVKYSDKANDWADASVEVQDIAQVHMQNAVVNTTVNYSGFTTAANATKVGSRDLRTLSTPLATCTIYAGIEAKDLTIGDVFKFSWPDYQISGMVMRVSALSFGDGKDNTVKIQCTQDAFSLPADEYVVVNPGEAVDPHSAPTPAAAQIAFELPYYVVQQALGATETAALLSSDPHAGFVAAAAVVPDAGAINATMSTDSGSGYNDEDDLDFCPSALLASAVELGSTSTTLSDGSKLANVEAGTLAQCGDEFWKVVSLVDGTLTMERALLDTVPATHSIGDRVFFWGSGPSYGADSTAYTDGDTVNVKVRPTTPMGTLALSGAAALPVTLDSRVVRPYPPGNVKINGENYPTAPIDGSLEIEFSHRDRLQQTSDDFVSYLDASIGPEAGTTYTFELLAEDLTTVLDTQSGITGTTLTLDADYAGIGYVRGKSVRGGYDSWQSVIVPVEFAGGDTLLTETDGALLTESGEGILLEQETAVVTGRSFGVYDYAEALPVRTGNRQVVFYRWSGPTDDSDFSVEPRPQSFLLAAQRRQGYGEPELYNLSGKATALLGALPPDYQERINSQAVAGIPGDKNLGEEADDAGVDIVMMTRYGGGPWPSDWCENFDTVSSFYDHAVVFPLGEEVYVPVYSSDPEFSAYPGQPGTGSAPAPEDQWSFWGYCTPTYPYPTGARLWVQQGSGFESTVTVAEPQISEVYFEDPIVEGDIYAVRLNGVHFEYVALAGDVKADVMSALEALVDAHASYSAAVDPFNGNLYITGPAGVAFRCEAAIVAKQLHLTFEGGVATDLTGNHVPVLKGTATVSASAPIDGSYSLSPGGAGGCLTIPRVGDKLRADQRDFSYRLKFKLDTLAAGLLAVYGEAPAHLTLAPVLKLHVNTNGGSDYVIYASGVLAAESGSGSNFTLASTDILSTGVEYEVEVRRTKGRVALYVDAVLVDETANDLSYETRWLGLDTLREKPFNLGGFYNINAAAAQQGITGRIDSVIVEYSVAYDTLDARV